MDKALPESLIGAAKDYFGFRPGDGLMQFRDEWNQLTNKDKAEIKAGLVQNGYTIKD